jgi:tRNA G18 (ribose-2'-O)-methylase SpoU
MNVIDYLKNQPESTIIDYCQRNSISANVAMINIGGDFNLSTMVRNANFFGFSSVYYIGSKKWDRRGSVGTHHYTPMINFSSEEMFIERIKQEKKYDLIAIENNIPLYKTEHLFDFDFDQVKNPVFVFGEENNGLSDFILDNCKYILHINNYGSVRSLNVGTTSGIVMSLYRNYVENTNTTSHNL